MGDSAFITAIIGFAAGVILASLNAFFAWKTNKHAHLARLSSDAFVDMLHGYSASSSYLQAYQDQDLANEVRDPFLAKLKDSHAQFAAAKARFATYGSRKAVTLMAEIQRRGGLGSMDPSVPGLFTQVASEVRAELGHRRNVETNDIGAVIWGGRR
ncbi:hypothetical protein IFM51744_11119 [Aspergillus udagawae]|nr:hypothetical protein IFM51744_11119 [Aspergillus udagawae]